MEYRAKRGLNVSGKMIKAGDRVPSSYPRLAEGLRRGWIEKIKFAPPLLTICPHCGGSLIPAEPPDALIEDIPQTIPGLQQAVEDHLGIVDAAVTDLDESETEESDAEPPPRRKIDINFPEPGTIPPIPEGPAIDPEKEGMLPPAEVPITRNTAIADLPFIGKSSADTLSKHGIIRVVDLENRSIPELVAMPGIGKVKAERLIDAYNGA